MLNYPLCADISEPLSLLENDDDYYYYYGGWVGGWCAASAGWRPLPISNIGLQALLQPLAKYFNCGPENIQIKG